MPVITLTSDYGLIDYRVAAIKGSILTLKENAVIADVSHNVDAYDLKQASYIVNNAYKHFPAGSVHIICVDSFFRKEVRSILYKVNGHFFLAADNGILSLIFPEIKPEAVYEITLNNRFDDEVNSRTLDIFVPAAVHLINGGLPDVIGRKIKNPKQLSAPRPAFAEGNTPTIVGEVMYIDNFDNLVSNISREFFNKISANYGSYIIKFRNLSLSTTYKNHTDIVKDWKLEREYHGKSVAIFNEAGLLELCIYKGSKENGAKTLFGLNVGEKIYIEFQP